MKNLRYVIVLMAMVAVSLSYTSCSKDIDPEVEAKENFWFDFKLSNPGSLNATAQARFTALVDSVIFGDVYDNTDDEYKVLMMLDDIQHYKQEFLNYVNGKDDALEYYFQRNEIDARAYAKYAVVKYSVQINAYFGMEKP